VVQTPEQIPTVTLALPNGTTLPCSKDTNALEGVCQLPAASAAPSITLTLSCSEPCAFWLSAYLNDVASLSLDKVYQIEHRSTSLTAYDFDFRVPNQAFEELRVVLQFKPGTQESSPQGAEMYANVGNSGALQPTQEVHQYAAVTVLKGIALALSREEVPPGTWVKLSIFTASKMRLQLSAVLRQGNTYALSLGQVHEDELPRGTETLFNISLTDYYKELDGYDLNIELLIYSGYP
jgi:hypothetical protein